MTQGFQIVRVGCGNSGYGSTGNKEQMNRCLGIDVAEAKANFILIEDVRGDFPVSDFFEQGFVWHARYCWLWL